MHAAEERTGDGRAPVIGKWRLVAGFWMVQAIFLALAELVWGLQGDSVGREHPLGRLNEDTALNILGSSQYWGAWFAIVPALMLVQAVIVWPVRRPRARSERGPALWASVAATALIAAALGAAAATAFAELWDVMDWRSSLSDPEIYVVLAGWCLLCFAVGFVLMRGFCVRGLAAGHTHESLLGRTSAILFTGTLIEVLAIIPLDVMARRKSSCYSLSGTLFSYAIAVCAGTAALGPAILLPILARRRKRWYGERCAACGYDMSGLLQAHRHIERCPECGVGWRASGPEAGTLRA